MIQEPVIYRDQFGFQRRHSIGRILNVGCNTDGAGLRELGAINLDLGVKDNLGQALPVQVIADARALPFRGCFDTVVLGEILEHMQSDSAVTTIREALAALKLGGRIVITMPHDVRIEHNALEIPETQLYAAGVYTYHYRCIPFDELAGWLAECGLRPIIKASIHYLWGEKGSGVVAIE